MDYRRGVSFVSLDFGRMRLIDQCAPDDNDNDIKAAVAAGTSEAGSEEEQSGASSAARGENEQQQQQHQATSAFGAESFSFPAYLSNTHQCAQRLRWSQVS